MKILRQSSQDSRKSAAQLADGEEEEPDVPDSVVMPPSFYEDDVQNYFGKFDKVINDRKAYKDSNRKKQVFYDDIATNINVN